MTHDHVACYYLLHWLIVNCSKYFISRLLPPAFCCVSGAQSFGDYQVCIVSSYELFIVIAIRCLLNTLTCNMASMLTLDVEDNL
jgi:hypothetical protein